MDVKVKIQIEEKIEERVMMMQKKKIMNKEKGEKIIVK